MWGKKSMQGLEQGSLPVIAFPTEGERWSTGQNGACSWVELSPGQPSVVASSGARYVGARNLAQGLELGDLPVVALPHRG